MIRIEFSTDFCNTFQLMINLAGNCLSYSGQEAKGPLGFVAPVAPQSMNPASYSQSAEKVNENGYNKTSKFITN